MKAQDFLLLNRSRLFSKTPLAQLLFLKIRWRTCRIPNELLKHACFSMYLSAGGIFDCLAMDLVVVTFTTLSRSFSISPTLVHRQQNNFNVDLRRDTNHHRSPIHNNNNNKMDKKWCRVDLGEVKYQYPTQKDNKNR